MKHALLFSLPLSLAVLPVLAACSVSSTGFSDDVTPDGGPSPEASLPPDGGASARDATPEPAAPVPTRWTAVPFAEAGGVKQVAAISPTDAYAVTYSTLFHYDGTAWTPVTLPTGHTSLVGVYAASKNAVYVLGSGMATVHAFDGSTWRTLGSGVQMTNGYSLIGFGGSELWVGTQWNFTRSALHTWNGTKWSDVDIGESQDGVFGLTGTSSTDLWGLRAGMVGHYDGTTWTDSAVPAKAVHAQAKDNVLAVGDAGHIEHFDGSRWSATESGTKEDLRSVWASTAKSAWASGARAFLHFDGTAWSDAAGVDGAPDNAVTVGGSSETEGWAMTSSGAYHLSAK